jgi:hypothetical protein
LRELRWRKHANSYTCDVTIPTRGRSRRSSGRNSGVRMQRRKAEFFSRLQYAFAKMDITFRSASNRRSIPETMMGSTARGISGS